MPDDVTESSPTILRNPTPIYPKDGSRFRSDFLIACCQDGLWLNVSIGRCIYLYVRLSSHFTGATNLNSPLRDGWLVASGHFAANLTFPPAVIYLDIWTTAAVFPHIIACAHISTLTFAHYCSVPAPISHPTIASWALTAQKNQVHNSDPFLNNRRFFEQPVNLHLELAFLVCRGQERLNLGPGSNLANLEETFEDAKWRRKIITGPTNVIVYTSFEPRFLGTHMKAHKS